MKRVLFCLPLLFIAPLAYFLGAYLTGAGVLNDNGNFVCAMAFYILPWFIAAILTFNLKAKLWIRALTLFIALIAQFFVFFYCAPPAATVEMMGTTHRLRREFPPDEMRSCADELRQKFHHGTLAVRAKNQNDEFMIDPAAVVVSDSALPAALQGHFQRVFIQKSPDGGEDQVIFALQPEMGIICDDRKDVRGFSACSMADGVEAYRYQRM